MIDKYQLDDLRLRSDEKGELARWVIQLQSDLDDERRKSSANQALLAEKQDAKAIEDNLIEQVGLMCDRAVNIHEKNVYGGAFCVLKYGILPYLRKQEKPPATE